MKADSIKKTVKNNAYLLKISIKTCPGYTVGSILEAVRNELVIFMEFTLGLNYVLECAEFNYHFMNVALYLGCLLAFVIAGLLYNAFFFQKIEMKAKPKIKQRLKRELYIHAREIDLACYDDPEKYNGYVLAVSEAENQVDRLFSMVTNFFSGLTSFVLSGVFFAINDYVSFFFIVISFIASLKAGKVLNRIKVKVRTEKNPYERKLGYVNRVFYFAEYAKEIRLNKRISELTLKDFDEVSDEMLKIEKKYAKKRLALEYLKGYLCNGFIIYVIYMLYLVYSAVVLHRISYSNVAVMVGTANRLKNKLRQFADVYPQMQEISMYVEKIKEYLNIQPTIISTQNLDIPEKIEKLELKNVSFRYSDDSDYVIRNVNMILKSRDKVAIVGYNGAGKSTLIKLIMRLYDPNEGEILLNEVNIKKFNVEQYRMAIGTLFQDFKIFSATVRENVVMGIGNATLDDDNRIVNAMHSSGFYDKLDELPDGLNTNLATEFEENGVNLSGGENQKLALSRVLYRNVKMIIMDEPSSALDPLAEYHLNHTIMKAGEEKIVLFISHRLSTTRIADKIYLLSNGQIEEEGQHEELLARKRTYSMMWDAQAGQYRI